MSSNTRRVRTAAMLTNVSDFSAPERGGTGFGVRAVYVPDAVVDPDERFLRIPAALADQLGLAPEGRDRYDPVRVCVNGHRCTFEPRRAAGDEVLIGTILLDSLGLVVGPDGRLIDDPLALWPGFLTWSGGLLDDRSAGG